MPYLYVSLSETFLGLRSRSKSPLSGNELLQQSSRSETVLRSLLLR